MDINRLKRWFLQCRRPLPWRENSSPYAVWVSEIMLQQTRACVVIPYFERWIRLFPTVKSLASASIEQVIKAWEGLGYYSRARYLHLGARYLMKMHKGEIPEDADALKKVKGIGPYTVGAIQSFAFKKRAAAIDGNVLRVFSRLFAIEEPIHLTKVRQQIETLVLQLLPKQNPWIVMEAFIELGALVCQKRAKCFICPLQTSCLAYQHRKTDHFPQKEKKYPITFLHRLVCVICHQNSVLLKKGERGKVMADLFEFPYIEASSPIRDITNWYEAIQAHFFSPLSYRCPLPEVSHRFTRYQAFLYPHIWFAPKPFFIDRYQWVLIKDLEQKPFSSGHRHVLTQLLHANISKQ